MKTQGSREERTERDDSSSAGEKHNLRVPISTSVPIQIPITSTSTLEKQGGRQCLFRSVF